MFKINSILDLLSDGKPHDIEELRVKSRINDFEIKQVLEFLNKFELIEIVDDKIVKTKKIFKKIITQRTI